MCLSIWFSFEDDSAWGWVDLDFHSHLTLALGTHQMREPRVHRCGFQAQHVKSRPCA